LLVRRHPGSPPATCTDPWPGADEAAAPRRETAASAAARNQISAGTRKTGAGHFDVSRKARDLMLADASRFSRVRAIPSVREGKTVGRKLFAIRVGDPLEALGWLNGDLLLGVGGQEVTSPDRALAAYARVRGASNVDVRLEHRCQPLTLSYRIALDFQ
jgi:general secretion pathway protein C